MLADEEPCQLDSCKHGFLVPALVCASLFLLEMATMCNSRQFMHVLKIDVYYNYECPKQTNCFLLFEWIAALLADSDLEQTPVIRD